MTSARRRLAWIAAAALAGLGAQAAAAATPRSYALPPGELRLSDARLQASSGERVTFTVALTRRAVGSGTLSLTLPELWLARSGVSGLRFARVPVRGLASSARATVRRDGRVVRFTFTGARRGDLARFTVTDVGLPARRYSLPFRWREDGAVRRRGSARVEVFTVARPAR